MILIELLVTYIHLHIIHFFTMNSHIQTYTRTHMLATEESPNIVPK